MDNKIKPYESSGISKQVEVKSLLAEFKQVQLRPADNMELITQKKTNVLANLVKGDDLSDAHSALVIMISNLLEFHGEKFSDTSIKELAEELYLMFFAVNLYELKMFFSRCKNWYYGNDFHKVSPAAIMDWAKQFMKPNPNQGLKSGFINPSEDISAPLHIRQWWNSSIPGTPTNLMNNDYNRY